MTWELSLAGLLIGTLVGLTGMGGGSLMTPLLVLAFGFNPTAPTSSTARSSRPSARFVIARSGPCTCA